MSKSAANEIKKRNLYFIIILVLITLIDLVLILNADRTRYTVVFIDGEMVSPFVVEKNSKVKELENTNENFIGWYLENTKYDFDDAVHDNLVLRAKYEEMVMHKVTFDTNGGNLIAPVMVKDNKTLIEPTDPQKENYVFKGWLDGEKLYDFNSPVTSELTLKALWEEIPEDEKTYTITFDTDGGSEVTPLKVQANSYVAKPVDPTKEGYTFKGWYLNNKLFSWNFRITSNVDLKAMWTARASLKLTFDTAGGTSVSPLTVYKGETAELPTSTKAGYVFGGWYYGKTRYTEKTKIYSSVKLVAKWLTTDEANALAAVDSIKEQYEILKGGTKIKVTYAGCIITNTNPEILDEIRRELTDKTLVLKFNVECGTVKKTATSKAIIKASTYTYKIKDLNLTLNGTNYDGEIFKLDGTKIANVLSGSAKVNEDFSENIVLIVHDEPNTSYVIKKSDD